MSRPYLSQERLAELVAGLTERDRAVLRTIVTVRLATGAQLERLHFAHDDPRHRRRTLASMVSRNLLDRLPRQIGGVRAGSAGYLYALGLAGQRVVDFDAGGTNRRGRRHWVPGWTFIAHALQVTDMYVDLVEARRAGRIDLFDFQGEPACWRGFHRAGGARATLKPDARICVVDGEEERHFFVEVDRGTESRSAIVRKLDTYRGYRASGREQATAGLFPWVLFVVPGSARERTIRELVQRQPHGSRELFRVVSRDEAVVAMTGSAT